ncbi:MAG: PEP-CTERM sorting domain-containing protein [Planctomycetota bacterium]
MLRSTPRTSMLLAACLAACAGHATGQAFTYTPATELIIDFDDQAATGLIDLLLPGNDGRDFLPEFSGETATIGSFGGFPDTFEVGIVDGAGPTGQAGDHALVMRTTGNAGGFFAGFNFDIRGLRVLGNGQDGGNGFERARQDWDYFARVFTDVPGGGAGFRLITDAGVGRGGFQGDFEDPTIGVSVDNDAPGAFELQIPNDQPAPVDQYFFLGGTVNSDVGWGTPSFEPYFFRGQRAEQLTRVGVSFPGGGSIGELRIDTLEILPAFDADPSDPAFLIYNPADFNTDESVDASDLDEMLTALRLQGTVADDPGTSINEEGIFEDFLLRKYDLSLTGATFDQGDVDLVVRDILNTDYGDVDLDGDIDTDDLAIAQGNLDNAGGWASGDVNGDAVVDATDIAFIQAALGGGPGIIGDYDDSGQVEQGDLNLVLNNWGQAAPFDPNGDPFATVNVDQEELNRVLNNWGSTTAPSFEGAAVPEPATLALLGGLALAGLRRRSA